MPYALLGTLRNAMVDDRGTWQLLTPRYGSQTGEDACVLVRTLPRRRTAISELIGSDPSFGTSGYQIAVTTTLSLLLPGTRSVLAVAALAVIVSDPDAEATKVTGKIFEAPVAKRPAAHFTVLEVGCVHPVGKDPETAMLEGSESVTTAEFAASGPLFDTDAFTVNGTVWVAVAGAVMLPATSESGRTVIVTLLPLVAIFHPVFVDPMAWVLSTMNEPDCVPVVVISVTAVPTAGVYPEANAMATWPPSFVGVEDVSVPCADALTSKASVPLFVRVSPPVTLNV
jgi:hypothetical protein